MKKLAKFSGTKNPWMAAALNFILPGLGYIYGGRRVVFGAGLIIVLLVLPYALFSGTQLAGASADYGTRALLWQVTANSVFAYDAYSDIKNGG
ncbi:MAG: hypothetical protein HYY37_02180 [Candidatus Aenigmarchaeota archaeon]|nr:hypothetical protein [Candidatus Aenigmarchaeota archaeon]